MAVLLPARPAAAATAAARSSRPAFRGDIEGLRAVAILLVVAFHAGIGVVGGGFVGVDVFFVLSGFLITGLLLDELARTGRISLVDFYARRIRRLLPLSTLVLAATAAAVPVFLPPIDQGKVGVDLVAAALGVANWRFAAESGQYLADTDKSLVLHYWSLGVEEQFYVVWPLLIVVLVGLPGLRRRLGPVVLRRVALGLGAVFAGSLVMSWQLTASGSSFAYYGLHTRAWELAAGAGLALMRPVLGRLDLRAAAAAAWVGAALVLGSALLMGVTTPFPGTAALLPVLGTVLLVGGGAAAGRAGISRLLSHPWPRFVGRVSYAWYLWHWPCLVIANTRWPDLSAVAAEDGVAADGAAPQAGPAVVAVAVAVSFALAVVSHYAVEQPLRRPGLLNLTRARSLRLGAALVAVSLASSLSLAVAAPGASAEDEVVAAPVPPPAVSSQDAAAGPATPAAAAGARHTAAGAGPRRQPAPRPSTPAQARADLPQGGACYVGFDSVTVPATERCRRGPAAGRRAVALIGDSHAHAMLPAFEQLARQENWTVYFFAKSACTVVDVPVWSRTLRARYDSCSVWRDKVLDRLAGIGGLDAVVIARYPNYRSTALQPDGRVASADTLGALWTAGARRSFERLGRGAARILVMRTVPAPLTDVPSCLSQHPRDVEACSFDRAQRTNLDATLMAAELAAAPATARLLDLTETLCPGERCQVVTPAGQVMYRDSGHLTAGYSAGLWRAVRDGVEAGLRLPKGS